MDPVLDCIAYAKAHDLQRRDATDLIEEFAKEISKMGGKCVDIGAGPGDVTADLVLPRLKKDAVIVGVDKSKTIVEFASKRYHEEGRLSFFELDIETLNLPNELIEGFDNAVSFYCLHWCQEIRVALGNIYKLLRPGGKCLIILLSHQSGFEAFEELYKDPRYQPYMKDVRKCMPVFQKASNPREKLRAILTEIGFEVLHCSNRERTFVFQSPEILKKHADAVNPFLERLPAELKEDFRTDLLREVTKRKIVITNGNNENDYSILDRYHALVAYFGKPRSSNDRT
ncbi:juvenile hormone acid O-methyltransferase [Orussus abietinus]|uniref:juvenile hormone acid O-methyltransferase n=1 Tax=Orussus abietinus TaxID=222816 RepID=UPI00062571F1|nr:juvenile hormone acid O-methyltransferase [Orussus abietinus]